MLGGKPHHEGLGTSTQETRNLTPGPSPMRRGEPREQYFLDGSKISYLFGQHLGERVKIGSIFARWKLQ